MDGGRIAAYRTFGVGMGYGMYTHIHGQSVKGEYLSAQQIAGTGQIFHGFQCLNTAQYSHSRPQYTDILTGDGIMRHVPHQTAQTRSFARHIRHRLSFKTHYACMNIGFVGEYTGIVNQEFCFKTVGTVQNEIILRDNFHDIIRRERNIIPLYHTIGIECFYRIFSRKRFRCADGFGGMDDLSLQIRSIHCIKIGNPQRSDTGRRQIQNCR